MPVLVIYEVVMEEVSLESFLSDICYTLNISVCFETDAFLLLPRIKGLWPIKIPHPLLK